MTYRDVAHRLKALGCNGIKLSDRVGFEAAYDL
jgi:hypothetical protein